MKHPNEQELHSQIESILEQVHQVTWWERFTAEIQNFFKIKLKT